MKFSSDKNSYAVHENGGLSMRIRSHRHDDAVARRVPPRPSPKMFGSMNEPISTAELLKDDLSRHLRAPEALKLAASLRSIAAGWSHGANGRTPRLLPFVVEPCLTVRARWRPAVLRTLGQGDFVSRLKQKALSAVRDRTLLFNPPPAIRGQPPHPNSYLQSTWAEGLKAPGASNLLAAQVCQDC